MISAAGLLLATLALLGRETLARSRQRPGNGAEVPTHGGRTWAGGHVRPPLVFRQFRSPHRALHLPGAARGGRLLLLPGTYRHDLFFGGSLSVRGRSGHPSLKSGKQLDGDRFIEPTLLAAAANLARYPLRSVVVVVCLVAICGPFVTGIAISEGVRAQAAVSVQEGPDLYLTLDQFGRNGPVPLRYLAEFRSSPHITSVVPRIVGRANAFTVLSETEKADPELVVILGLESEPDGPRAVGAGKRTSRQIGERRGHDRIGAGRPLWPPAGRGNPLAGRRRDDALSASRRFFRPAPRSGARNWSA